MKAKTHSGSQKRVKVTATGKFRTGKIGKRHLLQNKSSKSKGKGKYGVATHIANERKMKWGHQVAGLRTPTAKKNLLKKDALGHIIKTPRRAPVIKTASSKQVSVPKAPKTPKTPPSTSSGSAKKHPAKKTTPKKK